MRRSGLGSVVLAMAALAGCASTHCLARPANALAEPALPPGIAHHEGHFEGAGGVCLYEQNWRPAGDIRAVVVLVHGLKDHSARYAATADALATHGYAVYAFDQRGHGRSGGARGYIGDIDQNLEDLDRFMARVRAREPGRPVFLFGHSMGGAVVTLYTLTRRPVLAGLILSGAALRVGPDVSGFVRGVTRVLGTVTPGLSVMHLDPQGFSRDPAVVRDNARDPLVQQGDLPASTAAEILRAMRRIEAHAQEMTVPLLVMHGTADRITNPEGSRALYAHVHSADRTLRMEPGLYHDLLHEPESAAVLNALIDWLDARVPAANAGPTALAP